MYKELLNKLNAEYETFSPANYEQSRTYDVLTTYNFGTATLACLMRMKTPITKIAFILYNVFTSAEVEEDDTVIKTIHTAIDEDFAVNGNINVGYDETGMLLITLPTTWPVCEWHELQLMVNYAIEQYEEI